MITLVSELMALVALVASILGSISPEAALIRAAIAYFIGRFITAFWIGVIEVERGTYSIDVLPTDNGTSA